MEPFWLKLSWIKLSERVPVTVHIGCFLQQHVCGSFVDMLHSLFAEWRRMIVPSPVPIDSQEISDFEEVVPDCCL